MQDKEYRDEDGSEFAASFWDETKKVLFGLDILEDKMSDKIEDWAKKTNSIPKDTKTKVDDVAEDYMELFDEIK